MTPIAAGARRRDANREPRVCGAVVDRDRLTGEEEREVEVLLDERLGAEALGELGRLRVARLAALDEREDAAHDSRRKQDGDAREQVRAAAGSCAGPASSPLGRLAARGDELALELVQLERVVGAPVERGGETYAAVELALVASRGSPSPSPPR